MPVFKTMPALGNKTTRIEKAETDRNRVVALAFALADCRWQLLSAAPHNWTEPDGRRVLAAAFLRYHSAKLALEDLPAGPVPPVSASPSTSRLAA